MNKIQPKPEETLVVVVDPQKGFVDEDGTFAKTFGKEDLSPIQEAIINTDKFIGTLPTNVRKMFVRSEYQKNQFSEESPLSELCVPGINNDCEWSERITLPPNTKIANLDFLIIHLDTRLFLVQ